MSRELNIVDAAGQRSLSESDFPLQIGRGASADIRVPGAVADQSLGLIGMLDERPFLQPAGSGDEPLTVNGSAVTATRWLEDGDAIKVASVVISCELSADALTFSVSRESLDYATLPPENPEDAGADAQPEISPVRMRVSATGVSAAAPRRHTLRYAAFGLLALLLLFALYLFTARAVLLNIEPADAEVRIAGGLLKMQFGGRYLLRPGGYRLLFTAEGYEPLREEVEIGDAPSQDFEFVMKKLPGRVVVTTRQAVEARVEIDGTEAGVTPTEELGLEAGPHNVRLQAARYQPFEATLTVEGRDQRQSYEADLVPDWAEITVTSAPDGATISSGTEELGTTPAVVQLLSGRRELSVRREGYKTWRQSIAVTANEAVQLPEIRLQEADGQLSVTSSPSGAAVSVDDRYRGTTPLDVELSPGRTYTVILSKPGYGTVTRRIDMTSRRARSVNVELEARVGEVSFISDPPDAELYVDGKPAGKASQTLSLPARAHAIEVRKTGFATFTARITPKPGMPQTFEIELLTPEEAILAATPQTITTSQGQVMRLIAPGEFEMGSPRREQGRRANEVRRKVRLTRRFYIGLREVTNSEFREFRPKHTSGAEKYRELAGGSHPVVMLSWEDAVAYCNWLSDKESLPRAYVSDNGAMVLAEPQAAGYRLPTEAEWAWVARFNAGADKRKYPWGARMPPTPGAGNFADVSAAGILPNVMSGYDDGFPVTAPVGRFTASPLGMFDLAGNAAEWVNDGYTVYSGQQGVAVDPVGSQDAKLHAIRGSSWRHSTFSELRSAYRDYGDGARLDVGFRIARFAEGSDE